MQKNSAEHLRKGKQSVDFFIPVSLPLLASVGEPMNWIIVNMKWIMIVAGLSVFNGQNRWITILTKVEFHRSIFLEKFFGLSSALI